MSTRNPFPPGRRDECLSRDNWTCQARTFDPSIESECWGRHVVHHRLPKGTGGTAESSIHDLSNLVTLCDRCHLFVHANPTRSYESGLLLRRAS